MLEVGYRFPATSILVSNAALGVEYKDTTAYMQVSNVALMIEYVVYGWAPGPSVWIT